MTDIETKHSFSNVLGFSSGSIPKLGYFLM